MPQSQPEAATHRSNPHLPALAFLALLVLAYLAPVLLPSAAGPRLGSDIASQYLPSLHLLRTSLRHGVLPLWNPYSFSGTPLVANMQRSALFYPATALYCLVPVETAIPWVEAAHLFLAAASLYFLLVFYTQNRWAGLFAAVGWVFGGFFANRILMGHLPQLEVCAYLPLLMLLLERLLKATRVSVIAIGLGLAGALCVFAGYPESLFMIAVVLALRFVVELIGRLRERGGSSGPSAGTLLANGIIALVIAGGLSAVQLIPQIELIGLSARVHTTYVAIGTRSMPPMNLATLAAPDLLGGIARRNAVQGSPIGEMSAYGGVATLLLALAAPVLRTLRDRATSFYAGLTLLAVVLSLGGGTPLYHIAFALPGFHQVAAPMRWVFVIAFTLPVLAGLGVHALLDLRVLTRERLRRALWLAAGIAGFGALAAFGYLLLRSHIESRLAGLITLRYPDDAPRRLAKLPAFCREQLAGLCAFSVLAALTAALLLWRQRILTLRTGRGFAVLLLALLVIDLSGFDLKDIQAVPPMSRSQLAGGDFSLLARTASVDPSDRVLPLPDANDRPDQNLLIGISSAVGYDPIELLAYRQTLDAWEDVPDSQIDSRAPMLKNWSAPLAERWGVRYVITRTSIHDPELRPVARDGELRVYRKEHADPRAYVVHRIETARGQASVLARLKRGDSGFTAGAAVMGSDAAATEASEGARGAEPASLRQPSPNSLVIRANSDGPGLLVVADTYYPGWKAQVDGRDAPIDAVNAGMRGVYLPTGNHRVVMRYEPASVTVGAWISGITLVLAMFGAWLLRARKPSTRRR